uniref:Uncharacterized protein n=1 Tax=Triticum urartu TaxID=4572 RepID=A0A8R7PTN0_TRIUA
MLIHCFHRLAWVLQHQMPKNHRNHQFRFSMILQFLRRHLLNLGNQALTRPSQARKGNKSGNKPQAGRPLCKTWSSPLYLETTECSNGPAFSLLDGCFLHADSDRTAALRHEWLILTWAKASASGAPVVKCGFYLDLTHTP